MKITVLRCLMQQFLISCVLMLKQTPHFTSMYFYTMLAELESYFFMYWRVFINQPWYVFYHYYNGLEHYGPEANCSRMVDLLETLDPYFSHFSEPADGIFTYLTPSTTTDLNIRYHICSLSWFISIRFFVSDGLCTHTLSLVRVSLCFLCSLYR